jgi:hypothetical protein
MINTVTNIGLRLGLTTIIALCMALPVCSATSAFAKSTHGGGGKPGGGGSPGTFYSTVSNMTQLIGDINYIDQVGGTYTIYLQPNATFYTGLPAIGGTKTVNLTIIGNGDTFNGPGNTGQDYQSRMFVVDAGSSLTLDNMTLQNGFVYATYGGAIFNSGTLTISNCTLSGNTSVDRSDYVTSLRGVGGAVFNNGGTVIIENSILSNNLSTGANPAGGAIYNQSGTVTVSNCTFANNSAVDTLLGIDVDPEYPQSGEGGAICTDSGTVTISQSSLTSNYASFRGGGICNGYYSPGTVTVKNSSTISGNTVYDVQNSGTLYLQGGSQIDILNGNPAIAIP